jgi:competence protein ComEC
VPTQRALIMVAVVMLALFWQRHVVPTRGLALAALGVVIVDPLSVLSAGFWLSFFAVAVMLLALPAERTAQRLPRTGVWKRWGRVHLIVTVCLAPLTVFYFDTQSLVAPLANFVAVPFVGIAVVPTLLVGMLISVFDSTIGGYVLQFGAWLLFALWALLEWMASLGLIYEIPRSVPLGVLVIACVGVLVALLPAGVPGRWIGWIALALFWNQQ